MVIIVATAIFILSAIFIALAKPKLLLYAMVFSVGWHSIFVDIGFTISLYRLIIIIFWLCLPVYLSLRKHDFMLKFPSSIKWLFAFVSYAIAVTLIARFSIPEVYIVGFARGEGRWIFQIAMFLITITPVFLPLLFFTTIEDVKTAVKVFIASTAALCAIGWMQSLAFYLYGVTLFPVFREGLTGAVTQGMAVPLFGMTFFRMHSLGGEPRDFSMTVAVAIILLLVTRMVGYEKVRSTTLLIGFFLLSLFMSLSTSGLVVLTIGLIVLPFYTGKLGVKFTFKPIATIAVMAALFLGVIISLGILPLDTMKNMIWARTFARTPIELFDAATLNFLSAHPQYGLFGMGMGNMHLHVRDYLAQYGLYHPGAAWVVRVARNIIFVPLSGYLRMISEIGIIGLILFLGAYLSPIRRNLKYIRYISDDKSRSLAESLSYFAIFALIAYLMRTILIDVAFIALGWVYVLNRRIIQDFRLPHARERFR